MIALGIDCGTQTLKTLALDGETGRVLAAASSAYEMVDGLPAGHMEQDPATWWQALRETVGRVLAELGPRRREVRAIGVSGQQHGFVPLDAGHEVIRAAKLWCDTSTVPQCDEIRSRLGGRAAAIAAVGNDLLPGFTAPKILWLKQTEPAHYARLAHVALPHDFLNLRLTGGLRMEYGDASGTALLDVRTRTWSEAVCGAIDPGLREKLPEVGSSRHPAGMLRGDLEAEWGLRDTVVSAGGGDNMMAAIGTGNTEPGRVTASLGTSGTIFACAAAPVVDPQGEVAAFCDSTDGWLPLVCTMNVTVATEAFRGMFGWDHDRMDREIAAVPPGADGLVFLPYLQGERTPNLPEACGVLHGMTTSNTTAGHLARAAMEGVTLGMAYGLRRLRELGVAVADIRLTGGGGRSPVWRRICAEVFGCPVVGLHAAEGAALGAAIQALATAGGGSLEALVARCAAPDESTRTIPSGSFDYRGLLELQDETRRRVFPGDSRAG